MKAANYILNTLIVVFVLGAIGYTGNEAYKEENERHTRETDRVMEAERLAKLNKESTAKWYRHMTWGEAYVPRELNAESVKAKVN